MWNVVEGTNGFTAVIIIIIMCKYSWLYNHTNIMPTSYFTGVHWSTTPCFEAWAYYACIYNEKKRKIF